MPSLQATKLCVCYPLGSRSFTSMLFFFCQYLKDGYLKDELKSLAKTVALFFSLLSSLSLHFRDLEAVLSLTHFIFIEVQLVYNIAGFCGIAK